MKIAKDKFLHFGINFTVALLVGIYGVIFGLGLSLGKEYGDSKAIGNKWDWKDIVADLLGLVVGFAMHKLVCCLI